MRVPRGSAKENRVPETRDRQVLLLPQTRERSQALRLIGLALTMLLIAASATAQGTSGCDPGSTPSLGEAPWLLPFEFATEADPTAQQNAYYDFMWRTFVALNWPAVDLTQPVVGEKGNIRGQPNCTASIFDNNPAKDRVWETYPGPLEIFLPQFSADGSPNWGESYPTWESLPVPAGEKIFGFQKIPPDFAILVNQPGLSNLSLAGGDDFSSGPLVDQEGRYVRYQVGINQAYFEYLRKFEYYNRSKQEEAVNQYLKHPGSKGAFQRLPSGFEPYVQRLSPFARQGMVEVKAAWRILEGLPDTTKARYIQRNVFEHLIDGSKKISDKTILMGLVALHILRYTPSGIVAATFEQVDNVAVGHSAPSKLKPSFNTGEAPSPVQRLIGFENDVNGNLATIPTFDPDEKNPPISIYRVAPIPPAVARFNAEFQAKLFSHEAQEYSPLAFYELIGTQNRHPGNDFSNRETNGHEGPITGVYTNANNLINTALESYTQKNVSCIMCHVAARPWGVTQASFGIDHFKMLSFLMRRAQAPCSPKGKACQTDSDCCSGKCAQETCQPSE